MYACTKFESCNAPICPLDPDWRDRSHIDAERICFYLCEYAKPGGAARVGAGLAGELAEAIATAYPAVCARYGPIRRRLRRVAHTPSRLERRPGRAAA